MWQKQIYSSLSSTAPMLRLCVSTRFFSKAPVSHLNQKWRKERGLPLNPNTAGILTDGPDYSYLDGRPTPYGIGQMKRIIKQQQIAEQIIQLSEEIDFAVERHSKLQKEESERKQKLLDSKLKPKGIELLKKKK